MHDHLKFRKVSAWWVLRELKNRMGLSLQHLLRYADGEHMLNKIVTGDESWVHHYQPETMRASMQWKHPSSPSTKKLEVHDYAISWEHCAYCVLVFSRRTVSPLLETW
jgi:hypothetical protein